MYSKILRRIACGNFRDLRKSITLVKEPLFFHDKVHAGPIIADNLFRLIVATNVK